MEPIGRRWRWSHVAVSAQPSVRGTVAPKRPSVGSARASTVPDPRHDPGRVAAVIPADAGEGSVAADAASPLEFEAFYRRHRDEIGRALVFTLGDVSLGQEAVDEAMARAYQRWDQLAGTENPAGWVYVVGRRWGLSWRRSRRRERRREVLVSESAALTARIDPSIGDSVDLMRALQALSPDHRTVVVCRFTLGLSTKETAALLDVSEGTVKSRLARSIDRLRALLDDESPYRGAS